MLGKYDGCESSDRGCGRCGVVGMVDVLCGVRMGVGVGGVENRGEGVVSSRVDVSVAGGGGAR